MGAEPELLDFPSGEPPPRKARVEFKRLSCAELAGGDYAVEFLIEGVLVARQPAIVFGPPKALKTSVVVDAAISLATATPFLGQCSVGRAVRVALMSGESGLSTLQETAARIAKSKGLDIADIDGLVWSPDVPRLASPDHREALRSFLEGDEIEVLFVDPAYLAMPSADAGNLIAQGELLREVAKLCDEVGVTLCLVHHSRKNGDTKPGEPMLLCDVAWAGFAEFARQFWSLARREEYRHGSGEHRLWLTVGGSAGHSACWGLDVVEGVRTAHKDREWRLTMNNEQATRRLDKARQTQKKRSTPRGQSTDDGRRQRVIDALRGAGGTMSQRAIRDAAGLSGATASPVFEAMVQAGELKAVEVTNPTTNRRSAGYTLTLQPTQ